MTVSSGFFNSVNHDRLYNAEQLSSIFDGIIIDGVYENYGDAFMVTANPDANSSVIIGTGRAWFDHTWTVNDSQFAMQLDPPNELFGRTDAIVIDIDRTQDVRKNSIMYVKGSESSPDRPPTLIKEDLHTQYPIAYIVRPAGTNSIVSQSNITITVGTSVCPIVTGILESQNLENLWQQLDDEFNTWWDGVKATLDENTVTNLQNQIDELKNKMDSDDALVGLLEKPIAEAFMAGDYGLSISKYNIKPTITTGMYPTVGDNKLDRIGLSSFGYHPTCTLLPDGYVFSIGVAAFHYGATSSAAAIQFITCLTNRNGVSTYNQFDIYPNSNNDRPDWYSNPSEYIYAFGNLDVYPVTIYLIHYHLMDNATTYNMAELYRFTVSSTHQIVLDLVTSLDPASEVSGSGSTRYWSGRAIGSTPNTENFLIGGGLTSGSSNRGWSTKLTKNGVLSSPVESNNYPSAANATLDPVYYDLGNGTYGIYLSTKNWSTIDENSLAVTKHTNATKIPSLKVLNETEMYTLSEKNGVSTSKSSLGNDINSYDTEKISNYFIGGNNSSSAIPEGDFLAINENNRLKGLGPSGEHIFIGSNGGAAVLNKKTSLGTTINSSKIAKIFKGDVVVSGVGRFLLILNKPNSTSGNGLNDTIGTVLLLKEV